MAGVLATFDRHALPLFIAGVALPESPGIIELFAQVNVQGGFWELLKVVAVGVWYAEV